MHDAAIRTSGGFPLRYLVLNSTHRAVEAIRAITATIGNPSEISIGVSSAVIEQAAVTQWTSKNMQVAARSIDAVRCNAQSIVDAAGEIHASV